MATGHGERPSAEGVGALKVERRVHNRGVDVDFAGEIDAASSDVFSDELLAAARLGSGPVVINLGRVSFLDSSGLHALVRARQATGARLRLGTVNPTVQRVLEMTSLLGHLQRSDGSTDAD
jgi:anti-sigma B factor antagonist